jgi:hypothetical protein
MLLGDGTQRKSGQEVGGLLLAALAEIVGIQRRDGVHFSHRDRRRGGAGGVGLETASRVKSIVLVEAGTNVRAVGRSGVLWSLL